MAFTLRFKRRIAIAVDARPPVGSPPLTTRSMRPFSDNISTRKTNALRVAYRFALGLVLLAGGCSRHPDRSSRFVRQIDWIGQGVWLKADTHVHTQFSDGVRTVSEVAAKASEYGCDVLAITDHGDRELGAGTHEYSEAIAAARREQPRLAILAGIEWNIPPWGGDEHVTVLLPPSSREGPQLAEFKARFDDLGRDEHDPALADEGLQWLAGIQGVNGLSPIAICEHPCCKRNREHQIVADVRRWRAVNDVLIGLAGAPGHQGMQPLGAYKGALQPIDRWDPAVAVVGGAWDRLLQQSIDVWAAEAPSDFHDDRTEGLQDFWPGQFSATWLYAPERSAAGALQALRAGAFFAAHGHIAREVELRVQAPDLPRLAVAGEAIEVEPGAELAIELSMLAARVDWDNRPSRIDEIELIGVTATGAEVIAACAPDPSGRTRLKTIATPDGGIVLRVRGRRVVEDGPDLMFYTNPIRVTTAESGSARIVPVDRDDGARPDLSLLPFLLRPIALASVAATIASALLLLLFVAWRSRRSPAAASESQSAVQSAPRSTPDGAPHRGLFFLGWLGFVAFAVYGSWVPLDFQPLPLAEAWARFCEIPFLQLTVGSRTDWAVNVLLFVPIGFCGLGALVGHRKGWLTTTCAALAVGGSCGALSVAIEFSQIFFRGRTPSQNDIAAETIGGWAGVLLWLALGAAAARWMRAFADRQAPRQQLDRLLQAYVLGLIVYSLFPLDLTISPGELWQKYREGKFQFVPFGNVRLTAEGCFALASDMLLFVPVGMLSVTACCGTGRAVRSLSRSLLLGVSLAAGIEIAQTFVYSRFVDATQLVTSAVGILLGAAWRRQRLARTGNRKLSPQARRRFLAQWFVALAAYSIFLAVSFVAPFEHIQDPARIQRRWNAFFNAPLTSLYWSTEYNAVTQVLRKGLLFAPLGWVGVRVVDLAQLSRRSRLAAFAAFMGAAFMLAFGIEYAQIWRDETTANFTDVLLCTFGAAVAMLLAARASRSPSA